MTLCRDLAQARQALAGGGPFALAILDVNLPDGSGLSLLAELRGRVPVILLTANDLETDIVTGLELGAEDYITKPFSLAVLRARVNAQLRRQAGGAGQVVEVGEFIFDFARMEYRKAGRLIELSKTEQKLLRLLVQNRGVTLTESGEVFYGYAKEIVQLICEAREAVLKAATCHHGIRIGATFTIGEYLLPFFLREYYTNEQDADIDVQIADTEILAREIMDKRLHVALIEGPVPDEPNFTVETFWHDELVVVVPSDHPWSASQSISFSELASETLITREQGSGTRKVMELALARSGFNHQDLNIRLELGSTQAIKQAVRCHMGVAVISALTVQEE